MNAGLLVKIAHKNRADYQKEWGKLDKMGVYW